MDGWIGWICRFEFETVQRHIYIYILPPSHFFCPLFHFEMSQNIVLFPKIKLINLLIFLLYPYKFTNSIF